MRDFLLKKKIAMLLKSVYVYELTKLNNSFLFYAYSNL